MRAQETGLKPAKTPEEIADLHGVELSLIEDQLEKGIEVEYEHTDDPEKAEIIALHHLEEVPDYYDKLLKYVEGEEIHEQSAVGYGSGTIRYPNRAKYLNHKNPTEPEGPDDELEEEQVHPDDKIGQSMLKKMGVPSYFKSNKKGEVHQKKVDEGIDDLLSPKSDKEIEQAKKDAYASLDKLAANNPKYHVKYLDPGKNDGKIYALVFTKNDEYSDDPKWSVNVTRFNPETHKWGGTPGTWYLQTIHYYDNFGRVKLQPKFPDDLLLDGGSKWRVHGTRPAFKEMYEIVGDEVVENYIDELILDYFPEYSEELKNEIRKMIEEKVVWEYPDARTFIKAVNDKMGVNEGLDMLSSPSKQDMTDRLAGMKDNESTGVEKPFDEIEVGDPAVDYAGEEYIVVKWGEGRDDFKRQGLSFNEDLWSYISDEDKWIWAQSADPERFMYMGSSYNHPTAYSYGDDGMIVYYTAGQMREKLNKIQESLLN